MTLFKVPWTSYNFYNNFVVIRIVYSKLYMLYRTTDRTSFSNPIIIIITKLMYKAMSHGVLDSIGNT